MQAELQTAQFGFFTLDFKRRILLANGSQVGLHARAFDVLAYLIVHRDRAVHRDDILAHVWGKRVVAENNLSVQLSSLRKALAEAGCTEQLILTLPERRYQFVGKVTLRVAEDPVVLPNIASPAEEPACPTDARAQSETVPVAKTGFRTTRHGWLVTIGLAACAMLGALGIYAPHGTENRPAPRLSIVVLPFRIASADQSQAYLADAITDDITADLSQIPTSTVIARESAEAVKHDTPQQIGQALDVAYVLSGSVVPEDGTYHITARLIDAPTARQLWAAQFDATRESMAATRQEITRRIAVALHVAIDQIETSHSLRDRPDNPDALDLFFRARSRLDADTSFAGYTAAQTLLQQAIAKQPDFADAKAELAWMLLSKFANLDDPNSGADLALAKKMIGEALRESPRNPKALAARALEYMLDDKCGEATPFADQVLDIEPSNLNVRLVLAACATNQLNLETAAGQYGTILRLDPESPNLNLRRLTLGTIRLMQGKAREAIEQLKFARTRDEPVHGDFEPAEQAWLMLIAAYELDGRADAARSEYVAYAKKYPNRAAWRLIAYYPPEWRTSSGFQGVLSALQRAGMPPFEDEAAGAAEAPTCIGGNFASTPQRISGGTVVTAPDVQRLMHSGRPPLIVDLGPGIVREPDWVAYDPSTQSEAPADFVTRIVHERISDRLQHDIVLMSAGPTGCVAFNAARYLIEHGYSNVLWFRGGEEAWFRAGLATSRTPARAAQ